MKRHHKSISLRVALVSSVLGLGSCSSVQQTDPEVSLESHGVDESAGSVPCYIVRTPLADYYLEKEGGGLSSMIDNDGVDWIGFHKEEGSRSKGEFRGFPNAIHQQDGNYFHARNAATDVSHSEVRLVSGHHVQIVFVSENGKWEGVWDFYPDRCDFTMSKVSDGYAYWVLYEGVPGGSMDVTDFWISSLNEERNPIDAKNDLDLPDPEWIAFGDAGSPRMVYLYQHEDDTYPDRYYNMSNEMTVFGFGREGIVKHLSKPLRFSIGFAETTQYDEVRSIILSLKSRSPAKRD